MNLAASHPTLFGTVGRRRRARVALAAVVVSIAASTTTTFAEAPRMEFSFVAGDLDQSGGPSHDIRVGRFEVRNDQFAVFLNDALARPDDERGAFLFFDTATGDVYINTSQVGQQGTDPGGRTVKLFAPSVAERIELVDGTYSVVTSPVDYSDHPVTGVSWYGAVKFCNWMTLDSGLPASDLAYAEGTVGNLNNWRPVTITAEDWASRDLNAAERQDLIAKRGYRLPMDGGADAADTFNEWFKAASARYDGTVVVFDSAYGFGRNSIDPADANYLGSADPFEAGTTPVGFFDGVNLLEDGVTTTRDSDNALALYDLSGNVWEWVQDQSPTDPTQRRNRGGSWRSAPAALRGDTGGVRFASSLSDATGFRVVQSVPTDILVAPADELSLAGPWGGPYDDDATGEVVYRLENLIDEPVAYAVSADQDWIVIQPDSGSLGVGGLLDVTVSVEPNCETALSNGTHQATIRFQSGPDTLATRRATLTVREPIGLTPSDGFDAERPFGNIDPSPLADYTLVSSSAAPVSWRAEWSETTTPSTGLDWLTINGSNRSDGTLTPHGDATVTVAIDPVAAAGLEPGTYTATVSVIDECTGGSFERAVSLTITPPFDLTPTGSVTSSGASGGPFAPPSHVFTLHNHSAGTVDWSSALCQEPPNSPDCTTPDEAWIDVIPPSGSLTGGGTSDVTVFINAVAASLPVGVHEITLRFAQPDTGLTADRTIILDVTDLDVEPVTGAAFDGPLAGPFTPDTAVYTIQNGGVKEMSWSVAVTYGEMPTGFEDLEWLDITPVVGLILDPDGNAPVSVRVSETANVLPRGLYSATLEFTGGGASATRSVTLTVGGEAFRVPTVLVPADEVQAGGPVHDFRVGVFEVTNADFARFLNDALRHGDDARGAYLYHDADSGDVFINDQFVATTGTEAPSDTLTTRVYLASVGRIHYDVARVEPYVVEAGFETHPVVGVSWYGAAKFGNWLTLTQGMPESARIYVEGPTAEAWRPVSGDRAALLALPGYRLPMDGGLDGVNIDNEWSKAASRRGDDPDGEPVFGATFGFGRNTLAPIDANYVNNNNGDTPANGTTPVGFFDGVNELDSGETSADTDNGYGLYDLCGNAAEWVHDGADTAGGFMAATRGGHFNHTASAPQLRNDVRDSLPAESTFAFVGFRIVQSLTPVPLRVVAEDDTLTIAGAIGGPYSPDHFIIEVHNDGDYTHDDFTVSLSANWLEFDGGVARQIPPQSFIELRLQLTAEADSLSVGTHEATIDFADQISGTTIEEAFTLELSEPLVVSGADPTEWTGAYCDDFGDRSVGFTMSNTSALEMPWRVTVDEPWITVTVSDEEDLTGVLPGLVEGTPATAQVNVAANDGANELAVGDHEALVRFTNTRTNTSIERTIVLGVESPVTVTPTEESSPALELFWGDAVDQLEPITFAMTRCAACDPDCALEYEVTTSVDWLTLEPSEQLAGTLPALGVPVEIAASANENADSLPPGEYNGSVEFAIFDTAATIPAGVEERMVRLTVLDPIVIDAGDGAWNVGCELDLADLPTYTVTLTNRHRSAEIGVEIDADVDWLDVPPLVQVHPGAAEPVTLRLNDLAAGLSGEHGLTVTFYNSLADHVQEVPLTVSFADDFCVTPLTGFAAYGRIDGVVEPSFVLFRVQNADDQSGAIEWSATSDQPWLLLNDATSVGGLLGDGQDVHIVVAVDESTLPAIAGGASEATHTAIVTFNDLTRSRETTRTVSVTRVAPRFDIDEALVSGDVVEPDGPSYSFRIGRTHVTNAEYVAFLNDALAHLDGPRGQYLFFDTTTGGVYVNDAMLGTMGIDPGTRSVPVFSPASAGQIELTDGVYRVIESPIDYTDHPVSGVSWYGAVKFCNWLTLDQGMAPGARCYAEDTDTSVSGWRPVVTTTASWASRDLDNAERRALVTDHLGFRLPMDDGYNNPTPADDAADEFNEWYKAGAWNPTLNRHTLYGFGRDALTGADANFRCSGDPFEDDASCLIGGTTPAGLFDGSSYTIVGGASFDTTGSANALGLMDMTGNLHHWLNGQYAPSTTIDRRALRGGSWDDPVGADSLRTNRRPMWAPPDTISDRIGFRVVRTLPPPSADLNDSGNVDVIDAVYFNVCHRGPGGILRGGCTQADFDEDGDIDLRDAAEFFQWFGANR